MKVRHLTTLAASAAWVLAASTANAQFFEPRPTLPDPELAITTPESRAETMDMLSTKPSSEGEKLPWQQPAPVAITPPGGKTMPSAVPFGKPAVPSAPPSTTVPARAPAAIPFGRPSADHYQPIPEGPHTSIAVPVENIDAIEASEPAPATPNADIADPVNENPAEPTELTAPIFPTDVDAPPLLAVVRVLNKVTARSQEITLRAGETQKVGKIDVRASHCQRSAPTSLPDAAVLLEITEHLPSDGKVNTKETLKKIFAGWMYQSSPSVSALEHPVYDVTLVECKDIKVPEVTKPAEKHKKSKKK